MCLHADITIGWCISHSKNLCLYKNVIYFLVQMSCNAHFMFVLFLHNSKCEEALVTIWCTVCCLWLVIVIFWMLLRVWWIIQTWEDKVAKFSSFCAYVLQAVALFDGKIKLCTALSLYLVSLSDGRSSSSEACLYCFVYRLLWVKSIDLIRLSVWLSV